MTNRYAGDIRRIVGTKEDEKGLKDAPQKPSIPGHRGIGYMTNSNTAAGTGAGAPGQQTPDAVLNDVNQEFEDFKKRTQQQLNDSNSGNTEIDPNTGSSSDGGYKTNTSGVVDVEELIDGNVPQGKLNTAGKLNYNGGIALNGNVSTLNGITGATDCASGEELEVRFDEASSPKAAVTNSEGDIVQPEITQTDENGFHFWSPYYWTQGTYWTSNTSTTGTSSHPEDYEVYYQAYLASSGSLVHISGFGGPGTRFRFDPLPGVGGYYTVIEIRKISDTSFGYWIVETNADETIEYGDSEAFKINRTTCTGSETGDAGAACALTEAPTVQWYEDLTQAIQVVFKQGVFTTSPRSYNTPLELSHQSKSKIDYCFGSGRFGSVEVTKDGGFMIYETDLSGNPSDVVRVYGPDRSLVAFTDSTSYTNYRP